jgi:hypothetical protein
MTLLNGHEFANTLSFSLPNNNRGSLCEASMNVNVNAVADATSRKHYIILQKEESPSPAATFLSSPRA